MSQFQISYDIKFNTGEVVDKLDSLLDDATLTQIQEAFAKTIDPWTPFRSGALHSDITVDATGVTYNVPYAADKYYGTVYTKTVHPLATSHWDDVAMQTESDALVQRVKEILQERAKQLYG